MPDDELLQTGIAAAQMGKLDQAAMLLARYLKANPTSEQGWLWLGKCCTDSKRGEYCFRRVLGINPNNAEAEQLLDQLTDPAAALFADLMRPAAAETQSPPKSAPPAAPVSFFGTNEQEEPKIVEAAEEPEPAELPPTAQATEEDEPQEPEKQGKKKKGRGCRSVLLLFFLVALAGLGGFIYLFLSGRLTTWLPAVTGFLRIPTQTVSPTTTQTSLPPTATNTPTLAVPTFTPTFTPSATPTARSTIPYQPAFSSVPCSFDPPEEIVVECGILTVPENRFAERSGTIQLAVAVFHSTSPNPAPDPVIFLQGGPGGEAVELSAAAYSVLVEPFLAERDFITFDQRGTGLSKPALGCNELEDVYKQDIYGQIPASSRAMIYNNAFRSCHGMMALSGIDLNGYTTQASAADLRDLVGALGYEQVNLYGISYGTRLALVTMRDYPEIVRSAILDSVVPVETKIFDTDLIRYTSSLQALFDGCAADPQCNAAYPDLETVFWDLVSQLDSHPVSVTAPLLSGGEITELVNGADLVGVTLALLKTSYLIPAVPESIYRIKNGDYSTFIAMQSSLPYEFEGINIGLYISVMCHEQVLASTPEDLQTAMDARHDIGDYSRLPFLGDAESVFNICHIWNSLPPAPGENEAVASDIPALVIEGKYDPATPPVFGQQVAAQLSTSYYMEFPNQGHAASVYDTSGCAFDAILAFLDDPARGPDSACLSEVKGVQFVLPYTGEPPLAFDSLQGDGFTANVPADWNGFYGIYRRGNSPLDITQLAVFWTTSNTTDIMTALSSKLYGYQGFDAAPVKTGTRQTNGLTWSLYTTTSYGRPVELAMANSRGGALVVLLFCHKDELDALHQTVYLPIIDSVIPAP